jgi:hypothetical protein
MEIGAGIKALVEGKFSSGLAGSNEFIFYAALNVRFDR